MHRSRSRLSIVVLSVVVDAQSSRPEFLRLGEEGRPRGAFPSLRLDDLRLRRRPRVPRLLQLREDLRRRESRDVVQTRGGRQPSQRDAARLLLALPSLDLLPRRLGRSFSAVAIRLAPRSLPFEPSRQDPLLRLLLLERVEQLVVIRLGVRDVPLPRVDALEVPRANPLERVVRSFSRVEGSSLVLPARVRVRGGVRQVRLERRVGAAELDVVRGEAPGDVRAAKRRLRFLVGERLLLSRLCSRGGELLGEPAQVVRPGRLARHHLELAVQGAQLAFASDARVHRGVVRALAPSDEGPRGVELALDPFPLLRENAVGAPISTVRGYVRIRPLDAGVRRRRSNTFPRVRTLARE